jgi:hypothetical protein
VLLPRKRKVFYPPAKSKGAPPPVNRAPINPPTVAVINREATLGRADIAAGAWVTIVGTGANAGESGRVERLVSGVIPAAVVQLEGGKTRRVRTVDLAPSAQPVRTAQATE